MLNIHANRPVEVLTSHLYPIIVVELWSVEIAEMFWGRWGEQCHSQLM
jgi:hypothetical protein